MYISRFRTCWGRITGFRVTVWTEQKLVCPSGGKKKSGIVGFFLCTFIELWVALLLGKLRSILCGVRGKKKKEKWSYQDSSHVSKMKRPVCRRLIILPFNNHSHASLQESQARPAGSWDKLMWLLERADCLFTCRPRFGTGRTPVPRFRASKPGRRRRKKGGEKRPWFGSAPEEFPVCRECLATRGRKCLDKREERGVCRVFCRSSHTESAHIPPRKVGLWQRLLQEHVTLRASSIARVWNPAHPPCRAPIETVFSRAWHYVTNQLPLSCVLASYHQNLGGEDEKK